MDVQSSNVETGGAAGPLISNLTLSQLPDGLPVPTYDRGRVRPGIAHFGVGNFHRTHQAVYVDRCLHLPGQEGWGIVGIGISDGEQARAKADQFRAQDCLYSITEMKPDGGVESRVIGSMIDYIHAPSDPHGVIRLLSDPELRMVTLTITEGGYNIAADTGEFRLDEPNVAADLRGDLPPTTVFGFLVRALEKRRELGLPGLAVVSCDNLRGNGNVTRKAVLSFAEAVDPDLASWIQENVSFPNSMVDRIAPYVTPEDRERLNRVTGVTDELAVMSESHLQWVIEDDFIQGRPRFEDVGVDLRDDVQLFENVKGRMLNATHVLMSYPALLMGYRLVDQAMGDPLVRRLLETFLARDAIPLLEGPAGVDLEAYGTEILDRFSNPAVGDQLARIASDGAAKIPVFHAATISELLASGADPSREAFLLACYQQYVLAGRDDTGGVLEAVEPSLSPEERASLPGEDGLGLFRIAAFAPLQLDKHPDFVSLFQDHVRSLQTSGAASTLERMLS